MQNLSSHVLDSDRIGHLLVKLSFPAFIGYSVMTLYNVVDTIFIGQYIGSLGIAGLSIVFPFQMLGIGIGQMAGMGGASLISRLIGSGNKNKAEHALGNAITASIVMSLIVTAIGLSNPDFFLRLAGASETVLPYARDYMVIIFMGFIFNALLMTLNSLIIAEGNARVPMISMIIGAVLNTIFDAILIIWLGMGVKGAAIATVASQIISAFYFIRYYYRGKSYLKIRWHNLVPELGILKEISTIGIASLAMTLTSSLCGIVLNRMLVFYGGDLAISTFGIANRLIMFAIMPGLVIGQGLQPIVGFNYGAQKYTRILKTYKLAVIVATICCIIVFFALYFAPTIFIRVFTSDPQLLDHGSYVLKRIFFFIYFIGFIMVSSITFQALGKGVLSLISSIARSALFLIPLLFILGYYWQYEGVLLSIPASDLLTFALTLALLVPQLRDIRNKAKIQESKVETES